MARAHAEDEVARLRNDLDRLTGFASDNAASSSAFLQTCRSALENRDAAEKAREDEAAIKLAEMERACKLAEDRTRSALEDLDAAENARKNEIARAVAEAEKARSRCARIGIYL